MLRASKWSLIVVLGCACAVDAALVIDVGEHDLLPNTPGQAVLIFVRGGDPVQGVNLNAQVEDGGTELAAFGGSIDGPAISNVDIITGTIFAGNNNGPVNPELAFGVDFRQLELRTTTTAAGTVAADGLLATLIIDTSGFFSGEYKLSLGDTLNGPTDFAGISAEIHDGVIRIVPEAGALALGGASLLAVAFTVRRRSPRTQSLRKFGPDAGGAPLL